MTGNTFIEMCELILVVNGIYGASHKNDSEG